MAEAAHLHIYTSSHLHIFKVAVHMPGKGDSNVGNYILFPRVYTNYPYGVKGGSVDLRLIAVIGHILSVAPLALVAWLQACLVKLYLID